MDNEDSIELDMFQIDSTGWFFHDYKVALGKRRKKYLERLVETRIFRDARVGEERGAMIEKVMIKARQEVHAELFKGQVNNRRASPDIKKIRDKYRDELSSHINERRKEEAIQITPNVTLPPSMTYPMTP